MDPRSESATRADLEQQETRLLTHMEQLEARIVERLTAAIRDTETRLLSAFFMYQESQQIQFARLKADNGNANRAADLRLDNLESRIIAIEKKILGAFSGGREPRLCRYKSPAPGSSN